MIKTITSQIRQYMVIVAAVAGILAATSCEKETPEKPKEPTKTELLSTAGGKTWQIQKLYINDTLYTLTPEQFLYTKTFKTDSSYYDSDGISGKYNFNTTAMELKETVLMGGSGTLTYTVETLDASTLVLKLTSDGTNNLNTKFHFSAK